jgi:8-oxo-dGTP diphosphatase
MTETSESREYPSRPFVGVGIVALGPEGVLMIQRGKPPRAGSWSLPGGAQHLGETVEDAARREAMEETGLEVEVLGIVDVVDSIRHDDAGRVQYHYTLVDVLARAVGGRVQAGGDAMDARWVPLAELPSLGLWSETIRVIELAVEMTATLDGGA